MAVFINSLRQVKDHLRFELHILSRKIKINVPDHNNELPYQVNKAKLIESIAILVRDKKITGISHLRDESDRDGLRLVIELKKNEQPDVILSSLYKQTNLQTSFSVNMVCLVDGEPCTISVPQALDEFIKHRER